MTSEVLNPFTSFPRPEKPAGPGPANDAYLGSDRRVRWSSQRFGSFVYDLTVWKDGEIVLEAENLESNEYVLPRGSLEPDACYRWQVEAKNLRHLLRPEQSQLLVAPALGLVGEHL